MEEEKKLCTPQHSINGYVPKKMNFNITDKPAIAKNWYL